MNKTSRLQRRRYINLLSLATLTVLVIGFIISFTVDCWRQETINQKLLSKTSAQSIKYENPGILKAHDILGDSS